MTIIRVSVETHWSMKEVVLVYTCLADAEQERVRFPSKTGLGVLACCDALLYLETNARVVACLEQRADDGS